MTCATCMHWSESMGMKTPHHPRHGMNFRTQYRQSSSPGPPPHLDFCHVQGVANPTSNPLPVSGTTETDAWNSAEQRDGAKLDLNFHPRPFQHSAISVGG
jgi:hypothetical protein